MKLLRLFAPIVMTIAFIALAWYRLVVLNSDVLYFLQDIGYWQPGSVFLNLCLGEPGSIFTWVGSYLTQFMHVPALGSAILIGLWLAMAALLYWGCRMPWWLCWLAFLPSLIMLWMVTSLGYDIYSIRAFDWCFAPTLFLLTVSLVVFLCRWFGRWIRVGLQVALLVVAIAESSLWLSHNDVPARCCVPFVQMETNPVFFSELRMARAADEGRWSDVLKEMRQSDVLPSRTMWLYKNIALLYQDRLPSDWLQYGCETSVPQYADSLLVALAESNGPQLYFLHGSVGFCYRWSMEHMVECGANVRDLRNMTRSALIMGDYAVARRYLSLLENMPFQREWAQSQRKFIANPELLATDSYYSVPLSMSRARPNVLDGDEGKVEKYLIDTYSTHQQNESDALLRLNLTYAMQTQDISTFWKQFFIYANMHHSEPMPRILQEAAWLYGQLEPQTVNVSQMPFDKEVIETHQRFMQATSQLLQRGMSEKAVAKATQREFGKTFYWFYYFCRGIEIY